MASPLLLVDRLAKRYTRGLLSRQVTFSLAADFVIEEPAIVGVMGPNGSGKTTLFELITGSNLPSAGRVLVAGQDIHGVKTRERDRLAIHYHQSYQVRSFQRSRPDFMLDFFRKLRREGRLVFLCLHPNERYHVDILRECCERFIFVEKGVVTQAPDFDSLVQDQRVRGYLGALAP